VIRSNRTVSWTYNDADRPLTETIAGGTLAGWSVVHVYNDKLQRTHQRLRQSGTTQQETRFGYDTAGRLSAMTNGLSTGLRAAYSYLPNSSLIGTLAVTNNNTGRGLVTTRQYDGLNRLRTISSKAFGGSASALPVAFDYQYNAANQRTRVNREDGAYWVYTYDDLGQVISGRKYWGDGTEVAGQQFDYAFDTIGNRTATGGRASAVSTYTRQPAQPVFPADGSQPGGRAGRGQSDRQRNGSGGGRHDLYGGAQGRVLSSCVDGGEQRVSGSRGQIPLRRRRPKRDGCSTGRRPRCSPTTPTAT
jgi:YD repeat-containing protein